MVQLEHACIHHSYGNRARIKNNIIPTRKNNNKSNNILIFGSLLDFRFRLNLLFVL